MHATLETPLKPARPPKVKRSGSRLFSGIGTFLKRNFLCLLTVVLPTFLAVVYFGFIASKIYISESSFVVRSPQQEATSSLGAMLSGTGLAGFSQSEGDIYTVKEFIRSRDALRQLNDQLNVAHSWSSPQIDLAHRFGVLRFMRNFEYLYLYYQSRVDADLDTRSDITTLKVNTFSPDEAVQINQLLLQAAERLVNKLNDRARQDLIGYATSEVDHAKSGVRDATLALSTYRNEQAVLNPEEQANAHLELISKLQDELIATNTELANLRAFAPDSPNPPSLELKAKTLQAAMDAELAKVAGSQNSLSSKDAKYQQFVLERGFAEQQLASALASLETARNEAQRQQLYLEVVSQPIRPDVAMEPHRIMGIFVTMLVGFVAWGICSMLIAGIREHHL
jgi:capsular polysaccharide transport system permease protein